MRSPCTSNEAAKIDVNIKMASRGILKYFTNPIEEQKRELKVNFNSINSEKKSDENTDINVYTDGACLNNGKSNAKAGIGIFFGKSDPRNVSECVSSLDVDSVTNQTAELLACVKAIQILANQYQAGDLRGRMVIYTDSEYVLKSVTQWINAWKKNGWKNKHGDSVKNRKLIEKLHDLKTKFGVRFQHVRAHTSEPNGIARIHWVGNREADILAVEAARDCQARARMSKRILLSHERNTT